MKKRELFYTVVTINWNSHHRKEYRGSSEKWRESYHMIQAPHSWAYIWRKPHFENICTSTFIAALFTVVKTWMQSKRSTAEWIKKMWYIYTMEYYFAINKNEVMPFAATWMQLEIVILTEVSQKGKTNTMWYHLYVESKYDSEPVKQNHGYRD